MKRVLASALTAAVVSPTIVVAALLSTATSAVAAGPSVSVGAGAVGSVALGATAYVIPSGAKFVSPAGRDGATGTEADPWRTVAHAVANTSAGGTIVLRGGSYHEQVMIYGKQLTLQSYPGEVVWFDGSQAVTGFVPDGAAWRLDGWNHKFSSAGAGHSRTVPEYPMANHPDMVWVAGRQLRQVGTRAAVVAGTFFYDEPGLRLYIGDSPSQGEVRAATLTYALYLNKADKSTVRGIGFRRYATPQAQLAMVRGYANNLTFDNVVVQESAATGLSVMGTGSRVQQVTAEGNGDKGVHGFQADGLVMERTRVSANNVERFDHWAAAGVKVTSSRTLRFLDNVFNDNQANGLWIDESALDVHVVGNAFVRNRNGLEFELSAGLIAADNLFVGNTGRALFVLDSNDAAVWNNSFVDNSRHLVLVEGARDASDLTALGHDKRYPEGDPRITWKLTDVHLRNNVIAGALADSAMMLNVEDVTKSTTAEASRITTNYNAYYRTSTSAPRFLSSWTAYPSPLIMSASLSSFTQQTGQEARSLGVDGGANPFITDAATGRFELPATSPARGAGTLLPTAVAIAAKASSESVPDIGLLSSRALQAAGWLAGPTQAATDLLPAPTSLVATATGTSVALTWAAAADAASYAVLENGVDVASTVTTAATLTERLSGSHSYQVQAVDAAGRRSEPSASVQVVVQDADVQAPTAAKDPVAALEAGGVRFSWLAARDDRGVQGYSVFRNGVLVAEVPGLEVVLSGLPADLSYLQVQAYDAAGNRGVKTAPITVEVPALSAPGGLAATTTHTSVSLTWSASTGAVGYIVLQNGLEVVSTTGTSDVRTDLSAGTYEYRVVAVDAGGRRSASSAPLTVQLLGPDVVAPSAPSGLSGTSPSTGKVFLSWSASRDDRGVTGYTVFRNGVVLLRVTGVSATLVNLPKGLGWFQVQAHDAAGNSSAKTAPLQLKVR